MSSPTTPECNQANLLSRQRILIVEDDPVMQLGLEQFFEEFSQYQIIGIVTDGYLGVEAAVKLQPDLVVMDIGLPQLDGIAATQQIKANLPNIRVVILTSHQDETEMIAALAAGADACCIKGTSLEQLSVAISAAKQGATYLDPQIAKKVIEHIKPPAPVVSNLGQLSSRELEVLKLIVEGRTNPEIAAELYMSLSTVKTHIRSIMNKLAVSDRVQAAVVALRNGLL
ncbi:MULTISPECIES: response regulator transcription factor [Fischerella]|uniref:DNA-binding response regulator n=1 Tax=Fischerella muscicola CCMEE 5323 TaxID=2019572 RepID=A0A2N6K930_FISMU|nr:MULTISPECIES: response regulator transcription factor [Fischerella]MBD2431748.1 response regulator transcription factor [Fischerella sp. FACHB-380]PLZ94420.1 DNA-binding response regulator [Fischerella muscicola CCMEE 5323]